MEQEVATLVVSRPQPVPRDEPHNSHTHSPTSQLLDCAGASATHSHIWLISFSHKNHTEEIHLQRNTSKGTRQIFDTGLDL
jgi:hypothetical protein